MLYPFMAGRGIYCFMAVKSCIKHFGYCHGVITFILGTDREDCFIVFSVIFLSAEDAYCDDVS